MVTLASQSMSIYDLIPDLYAKLPVFKVPALYAEILSFYANIYVFGFHYTSNVCG